LQELTHRGDGLMNDKGLAAVINACWVREEEGGGLTRKERLSKVMETCSDVYQVVELLNSAPRFSKFGIGEDRQHQWNYLFADVNEGIASVEATHNYFAVKYGKETGGILASGNHHQFLDYNITGSWSKERKPNGYKSSWIRTGRMWDLLRENHGEIDFEKVVSFTKDTANGSAPGIGGYDSICRYEERDMTEKCPGFTPDTYEKGTCRAMIIQPKE
jgi:Acyl-coenzyme A:6-aminopenicillanic acid acyl-transferase.